MSVPENCTVLVIGGGPAGSYAAAALAREGCDVVVLEAEKFPRYHIGESMLPSIRHFLRFIDCDNKWNAHGFIKKKGAAFKIKPNHPEAYTDFVTAAGENNYAWNVIRSESDELLFKHAGESGAHIFDATKVDAINFEPDTTSGYEFPAGSMNPGKPVSAKWSRKDGTSGVVNFKYVVDASGRQGIVSTKYLKNRTFNQGLKNIANWGYWKNGGVYAPGTPREGSPFFEALHDASGWAWFIPLHDGTHSIGIAQNQKMAAEKKKAQGSPSGKDFYLNSLDLAPNIQKLLEGSELISDIKSASDWSYSASTYAFPGVRIVGDAGAFIDPYFSSGVHLAILGGLSAAVTISAALKGDCDENTAAAWHTKKTAESYTRFFLVVSSALKQIQSQSEPVIQEIDEEGFQRAFDLFRPIIQGTADADNSKGKLTQAEISKTVEFCFKAFAGVTPEQKEALVRKLKNLGLDAEAQDEKSMKAIDEIEKSLTPEELQVLQILRSRRMIREDGFNLDSFKLDAIDGLSPNMTRGMLGLEEATTTKVDKSQLYSVSYLEGKTSGLRSKTTAAPAKAVTNGTNGHMDGTNGHMNGTNGHMNGHANGVEKSMNGMNGAKKMDDNGMNGHEKAPMAADTNGHSVDKFLSPLSGQGVAMDDASRHTLISALNQAAENLETPVDTLMRFSNAGRQLAMIKVGNQLGVFKALAADPTVSMSVEELAKPTGADPRLVSRILRYLAASRLVVETGKESFIANQATEYMADTTMEGGMNFFYGVANPTVHQLPEFLEERKYQNPTGEPYLFNKTNDTNLELFPWLKTQPKMLKNFQNLMAIPRGGDWLSTVSFAQSSPSPSNRAVFVDVGGNIGHQCARLKAAHPELAGRIVLQDLAETVQRAPMMDGIKAMAHDFFTPQPVEGAQYYYLRSILHNWNDEKAVEILKGIVPSMAYDSQILIDEMVLPNTGAHLWPAGQDIQMMIMCGAMERTLDQWNEILDHAGLKASEVKTYDPVMRTSITFAQLK